MNIDKKNPLVSVIIPVYNVEPYLRQCLDSVSGQTYQNLEILVIDDGSTDSCGKICDEYAKCDDRIKVFHTENRGLSAARNLGLDSMTGEYVAFIDSDDWFELDAIEETITTAKAHEADLVIFQRKEHGYKVSQPFCHEQTGMISREYAIRFVYTGGGVMVWNKLYHRKLLQDIRFIIGKNYEDWPFTVEVLHQAERIYYINRFFYNYRHRAGSITKLNTARSHFDCFEMKRIAVERMKELGYTKEAKRFRIRVNLEYRIQYGKHIYSDEVSKDDLTVVSLSPEWFSWRTRIMIHMLLFSPWLFDVLCILVGKRATE